MKTLAALIAALFLAAPAPAEALGIVKVNYLPIKVRNQVVGFRPQLINIPGLPAVDRRLMPRPLGQSAGGKG